MKNNQILSLVLVALIFSGAGFFGGMTYQKNQAISFRGVTGNFAGRTGMGTPAGGMMNGRRAGGQVVGEIISQDDKSITVKLLDGSSKIVLLSSNTTIINSIEAKTSDLKVGSKVSVFGTTNTDGSVTAANVQLNPISRQPTNISGTPAAVQLK